MTQLSYWWTTSGTPSGHQVASYTQVHLASIAKVTAAVHGEEGVAPDFLNTFTSTVTGANTVQVQSGGALVDGRPYISDANENVNIPSTTSDERIDRIVLRADWANFQVTIFRIAGTQSSTPTAPAITQTSGTTYDIMLYQARVNSSGTVVLTDERVMAEVQTALIADDAVTTAKIADNQITLAKMADNSVDTAELVNLAVTTGKIDNLAVTEGKIGAGAVTSGKIGNDQVDSQHYNAGSIDLEHMAANSVDSDQYVNGSIDQVHLANDIVDDTKVGNRVLQFYRRQGGSATDWKQSGTTNYTPTTVRAQSGVYTFSNVSASSWSTQTITMPVSFSETPVVIASIMNSGTSWKAGSVNVTNVLDGSFSLGVYNQHGSIATYEVAWLAIGPE